MSPRNVYIGGYVYSRGKDGMNFGFSQILQEQVNGL